MQETQETRVGFLGPEDPLKKEMATHSSILAGYSPWDLEELDMTEQPAHTQLETPLLGLETENSMFLLGARSWAFGISFRARAALSLFASSFSQLSGDFPTGRLISELLFPAGV